LTVLNETWCKRHAVRGQPNAVSFDILHSVIIWQVYELRKWALHWSPLKWKMWNFYSDNAFMD
jgi:hypothetical protein